MISLRNHYPLPVLHGELLPAKLFVYDQTKALASLIISEQGTDLGTCSFYGTSDSILLEFHMDRQIPFQTQKQALNTLIYHAECRFRPKAFLIACKDEGQKQLAAACMFYPKGQLYRRAVEPWRYRLDNHCFDSQGYLIHQGKTNTITYGLLRSDQNGCGWIAAYNLLKLNGKEQTMEETVRGLMRFGFGELTGENIVNLALYLKRAGLSVHARFGNTAAKRVMKTASSGILLYPTRLLHSHYAAWIRVGSAQCQFFNAVYGKSNDVQDVDAFFDHRVRGFQTIVVYVDS